MLKIRWIFIVAFFVLAFSVYSNAQSVPDYLFLETIDSNGKPIEGATVELSKPNSSGKASRLTTDEKGKVRFYPIHTSLPSLFTILKEGYFPFHDLGINPFLSQSTAQVELLKIPQNAKEKQLLGNEQLKREFMRAAKNGDSATIRNLLKKGISPNLNTNDLRGIPGPKNTPVIIFAANSTDSETLDALIKAGAIVKSEDEPRRSILATYLSIDAFRGKNPQTEVERKQILEKYEKGAKILVKAGANFRDVENSNSPLMAAAFYGYPQTVKLLLDNGLSANTRDTYGTVLMYVADHYYGQRGSKIETVNLLLKSGADPNVKRIDYNSNGCTALMVAAQRGDIEVMRALIEKGAKINESCRNSDSALTWAVKGKNPQAVKYLLDAGAEINIFGPQGERIIPEAAANRNIELLKLLIDEGFPIDGKNSYGDTALTVVMERIYNSIEFVKLLLESGADPNIVKGKNQLKFDCETPLMVAVQRESAETIKTLIAHKADVTFTCKDGQSALTRAMSRWNSPEFVNLLIESGADIKGRQGQAAVEYMISNRQNVVQAEQIEKLLAEAGAKIRSKDSQMALLDAIETGQIELIGQIIKNGANINALNAKGESPVLYAVERPAETHRSKFAVVKLLLESGANPNIAAAGYNGLDSRRTALMSAAIDGDIEMIRLLVDYKADINFDLGDGDSALGAAVRGAKPLEATKLLLELGADAKGRVGQVALRIIKRLKSTGPNLNYLDVVRLLESYGAKD